MSPETARLLFWGAYVTHSPVATNGKQLPMWRRYVDSIVKFPITGYRNADSFPKGWTREFPCLCHVCRPS